MERSKRKEKEERKRTSGDYHRGSQCLLGILVLKQAVRQFRQMAEVKDELQHSRFGLWAVGIISWVEPRISQSCHREAE